jgi:hypothetical protein
MGAIESYNKQLNEIYEVKPQRWYESHPYSFQWIGREFGGKPSGVNNAFQRSIFANQNVQGRITFNLPITPKNITTNTHFATNVMPTLYGVVEEHSEVRFWDITIQGTTGIAPEYFAPVQHNEDYYKTASLNTGANTSKYRSNGRTSHDTSSSFLNNGVTEALDTFGVASGALGAIGQIASDIGDINSGGQALSETGVISETSGYAAFHNFYRFLLVYKKDAAGLGSKGFNLSKTHPLRFINYKDNVKWDCVPLDFQLVRDASDPMVYNYVIKLKCFNMRQTTGGLKDGTFEKLFKASIGLGTDGGLDLLDSFGDTVGSAINLVSNLTDLF